MWFFMAGFSLCLERSVWAVLVELLDVYLCLIGNIIFLLIG